jgi:lysophospholipase L1-like esterase
MVTLFIGMNDICDSHCSVDFPPPDKLGSPEFFEAQLRTAIERLRGKLPKTVINLIQLMNITQLDEWTNGKPHCKNAEWMRRYLCPCLKTEEGRKTISNRLFAFNAVIEKVAKSYTKAQAASLYEIDVDYDMDPGNMVQFEIGSLKKIDEVHQVPKYKDFAVILSPTVRNLNLTKEVPIEFVSEFDCFHPSVLGHESIAIALW